MQWQDAGDGGSLKADGLAYGCHPCSFQTAGKSVPEHSELDQGPV